MMPDVRNRMLDARSTMTVVGEESAQPREASIRHQGTWDGVLSTPSTILCFLVHKMGIMRMAQKAKDSQAVSET